MRYILRKNESETWRERQRLEDNLEKPEAKLQARNEQVRVHPRYRVEAGQRVLSAWIARYMLTGLVEIQREGQALKLRRKEEAITCVLDGVQDGSGGDSN
ncbi:MAG TPA: hypothetical protein VFD30_09115 [Terriglobia bacterium]|nr:hypothetical protein [Terriglobia bacterium]